MTQRTRNHSVEFLLSVTATTVTRKVKLLYHHCLPLLGQEEVGRAWTQIAEKRDSFPKDSPAAGPAEDPLWDMEPWSKAEAMHTATHEELPAPLTRRMVLGISKTHWHQWEVQLLRSLWIKAKPAAGDMFSWDICWKQQMVDFLIQMCQLRLWVQLVTTASSVILLVIQWWKLPKKKIDHVKTESL